MLSLGNYFKNDTTLKGGHFLNKMCVHQKFVTNPYTGQRIYVKCGKCPACLQEKADRLTSRLNNHSSDYSKVAIFSTLTYKEEFIPYVLKQDIENNELYELPIYRDFIVRRFKNRHIIRSNLDTNLSSCPIDYLSLVNQDTGQVIRENIYFHGNLWKKGRGFHPQKMGIIYYKDVQDFKKRLRISLQRKLGVRFSPLEIFVTSEYGETHFRPHFHILVYTEKDNVVPVMSAICENWQYAADDDVRRSTQIGIKPAAYVSSYVNSPTNLPNCFAALAKVKHSFSPSIGCKAPCFSLQTILKQTDNGTLSYVKQTVVNGVPTLFDVPIPKYIINRYFPLFKGLCRCSPDSLDCLLRFPYTTFKFRKCDAITDYNKRFRHGELVDDKHINYVRLCHAIDYYCACTGLHPFDYAIDYQRVWNCYKNTLYKMQFSQDVPMMERYDNIKDLLNGSIRNDTLSHFVKEDSISDSNFFGSTVKRTTQMANKYYAKTKISKENNYIRVKHLNKDL